MAGIYGMGMMYRDWFAEELVWIIIIVVISPDTIYTVSPATIVMITNTAFPPGHITSATDSWRLASHKVTFGWNKARIASISLFGSMSHTI
jgi:hypothetical protein